MWTPAHVNLYPELAPAPPGINFPGDRTRPTGRGYTTNGTTAHLGRVLAVAGGRSKPAATRPPHHHPPFGDPWPWRSDLFQVLVHVAGWFRGAGGAPTQPSGSWPETGVGVPAGSSARRGRAHEPVPCSIGPAVAFVSGLDHRTRHGDAALS